MKDERETIPVKGEEDAIFQTLLAAYRAATAESCDRLGCHVPELGIQALDRLRLLTVQSMLGDLAGEVAQRGEPRGRGPTLP